MVGKKLTTGSIAKATFLFFDRQKESTLLRQWACIERQIAQILVCYRGDVSYQACSMQATSDSHQDLSIEGLNFNLSSLEVGHWVAET